MSTRSNVLRLAVLGLLVARAPRWVRSVLAFALLGALLTIAVIALAATSASAADSLPSAMLGTWCTQEDDEKGTPMKRCAPGAPNVITMRRHVIDTTEGPCRVVSVRTLSATRWVVSVDCEAEPDRTYGWQFFRDGKTLYLTPVGGFVPK